MVKSLLCKHLRANDYSAVMVKLWLYKGLWKAASFLGGGACVRAIGVAVIPAARA